MLLKAGASVHIKDNLGSTALMHAASGNCKDVISLLIKYSANISTKNNEGHTALMIAQERNYTDIVKLLEETAETTKKKINISV